MMTRETAPQGLGRTFWVASLCLILACRSGKPQAAARGAAAHALDPVASSDGGTASSATNNPGLPVEGVTPDATTPGNIELPAVIDRLVSLPPRRRIVVARSVHIVGEGLLEVPPGVTIAFDAGAGLFVDGGTLVARGKPDERVVFEATEDHRPGAWIGIVFNAAGAGEGEGHARVELEHVIVRHAGADRAPIYGAAITMVGHPATSKEQPERGEIALRDVALYDNANRGLDAPFPVRVRWERLEFGKNGGVSARVAAELASQLGDAPTEIVEIRGPVRRSVSLPNLRVPYLVAEPLHVGGFSERAVLTLMEGTIMRFLPGTGILVGGLLGPGGLVARAVTFSTAQMPPAAGSWGSIHFLGDATGELEESIIEYGGKNAPVVLATARSRTEPRITRCTFRNNAGPAIGAARSCVRWSDPRLGNVSTGEPPCAVVH